MKSTRSFRDAQGVLNICTLEEEEKKELGRMVEKWKEEDRKV
jgi:hypothetical protein